MAVLVPALSAFDDIILSIRRLESGSHHRFVTFALQFPRPLVFAHVPFSP